VRPTRIAYFASPAEFGEWLDAHHAAKTEVWVGFLKKGTGRPSLTWPESVDEALRHGWIDGIRKRVDDDRYTIRFTPRKPGSVWSAINIRKAKALIASGRMRPGGLAAFRARRDDRSAVYSFEQARAPKLPATFERTMKKNASAWAFFRSRTEWYRRTSSWWVVSAKREETREKRLAVLIACSEARRPIPGLPRAPEKRRSK